MCLSFDFIFAYFKAVCISSLTSATFLSFDLSSLL